MTPSLISLLDDDDPFIPNLIRQAFGHNQKRIGIDVLAGVVDQISHRTEKPGQADGHTYYGSEGLSLCFSRSSPTIPDLWSTAEESLDQSRRLPHQQGTISFRIATGFPSYSGVAFSDTYAAVRTLDLPLANTVFLNGRTSTLVTQRWAVNPIQGSIGWLAREKQKSLDQQVVCLYPFTRTPLVPHLEMPAYFIPTPPQTIEGSMGNIIRTFRTRTTDSNYPSPTPASAEIEKALPYWVPGAPYEVWAQVIPHERWSCLPQLLGSFSDVDQGHRFHKVLSGGGGWANKQGLIALDPQSSFRSIEDQAVFGDGEDLEVEQRRALGEVARPGDVVRFLAFKQVSRAKTNQRPKRTGIVGTSVRIGSIPSHTGENSQQLALHSSESHDSGFFVDPGHFGALSETGLSMHVQVPTEGTNGLLETVVQTKLPPFTSFTWSRSSAGPDEPEFGKPSVDKLEKGKVSKPFGKISVSADIVANDRAIRRQRRPSDAIRDLSEQEEPETPLIDRAREEQASAGVNWVKVRRVIDTKGSKNSTRKVRIRLRPSQRKKSQKPSSDETGREPKVVEEVDLSAVADAAGESIEICKQLFGKGFTIRKFEVGDPIRKSLIKVTDLTKVKIQ